MSDNYSKPLSEAIELLEKQSGFAKNTKVITVHAGSEELQSADVVICYVHTGQVVQRFASQMQTVIDRGGAVYAVGSSPEAANYQAWGMQFDPLVEGYFENPSPKNIVQLIQFLSDRHLGSAFKPDPPQHFPEYALIDWRTGERYEDIDSFQQAYDPMEAPWIGLYGFRYAFVTGQDGYLRSYAKALSEAGFNVMLFYGFPLEHAIDQFCLDPAGKSRIEVLINCSSLPGGSPEKLAQSFARLDVPVINGISVSQSKSIWEKSRIGISVAERTLALVRPEIMGQVQPTVLTTQEDRVDSLGNSFTQKEPLPERIAHVVDRVKAWVTLRTKPQEQKKITLVYYNGHPGKHNIGASYLNVLPKSMHSILTALEKSGYHLGGHSPSQETIFQRVMAGGRNIGTWAPEELKRMVEEDQPVLIPMDAYKKWFADLHPKFQHQVVQKWGQPDTARIMVWTSEKKKRYFVLPQIRFGNIDLMPQPARGWEEDEEALFHDVSLPPHHQYIAFYLYLQKQRKTDAVIHLGTHGTLEWLSGREAGLDAEDAPDALLGSMININPYIMDNVGEGTQAKRRGGAVIIDHLTPPFQQAGWRPELRELAGAINDYHAALEKSAVLADAHFQTIKRLANKAHILRDLGLEPELEETDIQQLEHYLQELGEKQTPMGMHTFGVSPDPEQARLTAVAMASRQKDLSASRQEELANTFYRRIVQSGPAELQSLLDALDGQFIDPGLGNDPIRNPDALPTGKNFYAFDPARMPTDAIYQAGSLLADQLVQQYTENHQGAYPDKVAFNLWSVETIRHEGIMESQLLSLLGVRPTYDGFGKINGLALIPQDSLDRPRVDVVVTPSGLYRDMFPQMMDLLDQAISLVYHAPEENNAIKMHTDSVERQLQSMGLEDPELRKRLALVRMFGTASGTYGIGVDNAVQASDKWDDNQDIAEVYFNRSGHLYGQGFWGADEQQISELTGKDLALSLFKKTLSGTKTVVHSRSSNLYGVLDNDDFFQYLGGMTLAIKTLDGTEPDIMVSNLTDPAMMRQESLDKFIGRELNTRYLNPDWITGMLDEGYAGARMVGQITDNMWGWQATTEQAIRAEDWQEWHDVYVADKYALDIQQRFTDADNVYAYQNMLARMLEVSRKDYWNPEEETVNSLISAYLETVKETGLSCSDQVCGNEKLLNYLQQHAQGDQKQAIQTLHRQLGRIGNQTPTTNRQQSNPQPPTRNASARAANTGGPSQPPSKDGTASQELTGYKMEEEVWFQANEIHREHENLYRETALLLLALFGLGFMLAGRPK
ncbi:MAG: cobaltochelatase subunit CobN [Sphingobacterium sp.]